MTLEDDLAKLERQVLGKPRVRTFRDTVARLRRMIASESTELVEFVLGISAPAVQRDLTAAVTAAYHTGVDSATGQLDERVRDVPTAPPRSIMAAAKKAAKGFSTAIADARKLARAGADPGAVTAPVLAAGVGLERDVVTLVNRAGNAGVTAVADAAGLPTVWVAEFNACVECLAYSGRVAKPGRMFPGGLSYGKSHNPEPIDAPPRHPHCRCTVEPLRHREYAQALRREADRSVLRGFSLESESMSTRVDAARRLVEHGVEAPKSVIAYARRAVKAGEFPTRGRP